MTCIGLSSQKVHNLGVKVSDDLCDHLFGHSQGLSIRHCVSIHNNVASHGTTQRNVFIYLLQLLTIVYDYMKDTVPGQAKFVLLQHKEY